MIFEKIVSLLSEQLGVDAESITMETSFEELGADSVDVVDLTMAVEEAFNLEDLADENLSGEGIELYLQPCSWWLRTCGREDGDVAAVEEDGSVNLVGKDSGCDEVGLRPAIWLDLDRIARLPELLRPDQL